jgi:hypothetical protein
MNDDSKTPVNRDAPLHEVVGGKAMNVSQITVDHVRVEYDKPSSLFGQFGNAKVMEVAVMLDQKLEQLLAKALQ